MWDAANRVLLQFRSILIASQKYARPKVLYPYCSAAKLKLNVYVLTPTPIASNYRTPLDTSRKRRR